MSIGNAREHSVDAAFQVLAGDLTNVFDVWDRTGRAPSDSVLDEIALRSFELQYHGIEAYRRYCERRGVAPDRISDWTEIPAVPVPAFRHVPLIVGGEEAAQLIFQTSGTTGGPASRGRHYIRDPKLYRASMEAAFRRLCLGAGASWRFASLVPPFRDGEDSSLAWMIDGLMDRFGADGSHHLASGAGIDWASAADFADSAAAGGSPVCILATTLGLEAWIRRLQEEGRRHRLPAGSIVMDTGGTKGRDHLGRSDVCAGLVERLGVAPDRIVNEFGMTELLSQLYSVSGSNTSNPWLEGPPWLRVRALDPNDLSELSDGESGLLCYLDLANLGSVCAVLTEDIGRVRGRSVQWLRRYPGARPRGCSLATAELLAAQASPPSA